ncbi:MAG: ABC transporter permease [Planctomycetes bacterium]|nr:ABC transporter permease [Planctomycetota bacterium]
MRKIWKIAAREYVENVKTKAFIIGIILTPLLILIAVGAQGLMVAKDRAFILVDASGLGLDKMIEKHIEVYNETAETKLHLLDYDPKIASDLTGDALNAKLTGLKDELLEKLKQDDQNGELGADKKLFGFFIVRPEFLTDDDAAEEGSAVEYYSLNKAEANLRGTVSGWLTTLRKPLRMQAFTSRMALLHPADSQKLVIERKVRADLARNRLNINVEDVPVFSGNENQSGANNPGDPERQSGGGPRSESAPQDNPTPSGSRTPRQPGTSGESRDEGDFDAVADRIAELFADAAAKQKRRFHILDETGIVLPMIRAAFERVEKILAEASLSVDATDPEANSEALERQLAEIRRLEEIYGEGSINLQEFPVIDFEAISDEWRLADFVPPALEGSGTMEDLVLRLWGIDGKMLPGANETDESPALTTFEDALGIFENQMLDGKLDAFLVVRRSFISNANAPAKDSVTWNVSRSADADRTIENQLLALFKMQLWNIRMQSDISASNIRVSAQFRDLTTGEVVGKGTQIATMFVPYVFGLLLLIGIMMSSQLLLTSVIEEKGNRIIEVLLSSVTPTELMTGKIVGLGLVGFTLLCIWGAGGYFAGSTAFSFETFSGFVSTSSIVFMIVYFVLGFILFSAMIAAVGSVCNTLKEAQNLVGPINMFIVLPVMFTPMVAQDPSGGIAVALSHFPLTAPILMLARISTDTPPGWIEIAINIFVMIVSAIIVLFLAGKIFRIGILMYGKPPKLSEMLRWLKYS